MQPRRDEDTPRARRAHQAPTAAPARPWRCRCAALDEPRAAHTGPPRVVHPRAPSTQHPQRSSRLHAPATHARAVESRVVEGERGRRLTQPIHVTSHSVPPCFFLLGTQRAYGSGRPPPRARTNSLAPGVRAAAPSVFFLVRLELPPAPNKLARGARAPRPCQRVARRPAGSDRLRLGFRIRVRLGLSDHQEGSVMPTASAPRTPPPHAHPNRNLLELCRCELDASGARPLTSIFRIWDVARRTCAPRGGPRLGGALLAQRARPTSSVVGSARR